jgi:uncharacterized protein YbcC (UPF0753/DUF2309 family)
MKNNLSSFDLAHTLEELRRYLPTQRPLKDFIYLNPLHALQGLNFFEANSVISTVFGYQTSFSLGQYQTLYREGRIKKQVVEKVLQMQNSELSLDEFVCQKPNPRSEKSIGKLRRLWNEIYFLDLNALVYARLFRVLNSYLDQGISVWAFPAHSGHSFLSNLRSLEKNSLTSLFFSNRSRDLFLDKDTDILKLLRILVGKNEGYFRQYLFDQQFGHPGWSGMVAILETTQDSLLKSRRICLEELIFLELALEIDALDSQLGKEWEALEHFIEKPPLEIDFEPHLTPYDHCIRIWQESYEWSYFDEVLAGLSQQTEAKPVLQPKFQALFCIDDRECSTRRNLETLEPNCQTFGTPGFFGVAAYFKPHGSAKNIKVCPAPWNAKHLIKEQHHKTRRLKKNIHFSAHTHTLWGGLASAFLLGYLSILNLLKHTLFPKHSSLVSSSLEHLHLDSKLSVEHEKGSEDGLQVGFTVDEMVDIVEKVLKSIGLTQNFAPLVYVVSHGATTANNPYFAAYDCGACSGRPGSANARAFAQMANFPHVRAKLSFEIPEQTAFIPVLHDTTRDEFVFYDTNAINKQQKELHQSVVATFAKTGDLNSKERARRFDTLDVKQSSAKLHQAIIRRSVSIFETRPELDHAGDAICIIAPRTTTKRMFLDRRSFLNSYEPQNDFTGDLLYDILSAAIPVCGGINLQYYYSKVDNNKFGAGSKLPLNIMGLIGVANGVDGDLKTGLAAQMVEQHEPLRLLFIVEQRPELVLSVLKRNEQIYEWVKNEWVLFCTLDPKTKQISRFENGEFVIYEPLENYLDKVTDVEKLYESERSFISPKIIS